MASVDLGPQTDTNVSGVRRHQHHHHHHKHQVDGDNGQWGQDSGVSLSPEMAPWTQMSGVLGEAGGSTAAPAGQANQNGLIPIPQLPQGTSERNYIQDHPEYFDLLVHDYEQLPEQEKFPFLEAHPELSSRGRMDPNLAGLGITNEFINHMAYSNWIQMASWDDKSMQAWVGDKPLMSYFPANAGPPQPGDYNYTGG